MRRLRGQRGFSLIETLIALGILGLIGMAFMAALGTGTRASGTLDEQVQAAALARTQFGDILSSDYKDCDPPVPPNLCYPTPSPSALPPQYSVSIQVMEVEDIEASITTLQKITVSISRPGKPVLSLATYRKK